MKNPIFYEKEEDAEILLKALNNIPHQNIEGLATLSHQTKGIIIKLRFQNRQDVEKILPENYKVIEKDAEGIFFESCGFRYLSFYSG